MTNDGPEAATSTALHVVTTPMRVLGSKHKGVRWSSFSSKGVTLEFAKEHGSAERVP